MTPSTEHLQAFPAILLLRRLTKALAMLDAILSPEWESRYYSYNSQWAAGEGMASMRNGAGDEWFLLFTPCGAALKGFARKVPLARDRSFPQRIHDTVPGSFSTFLHEPAFQLENATFCLWRSFTDPMWNAVLPVSGNLSADADGSADLLGILDGNPQTYQAWAESYYERDVSAVAIGALYEHAPLHESILAALNPEVSLDDVTMDAKQIGYPDVPDA